MASRSPRTLADALREFVRHFSARVLLTWAAVALIAKVVIGEWSWWNLVVAAVIVAAQPFVEWIIHVTVLHAKPVNLKGRSLDTIVARDHRLHHTDPRDIPLIFIPSRWVIYLVVIATAISLLVPGLGNKATAWLIFSLCALTYEWVHFLIHTDYKPKTRAFRHVYSSHRLHHYRSEKFWFGVTNDLGDRVLGTAPQKDDVPVSKTARDIARSE